jgi:hypothetical protein
MMFGQVVAEKPPRVPLDTVESQRGVHRAVGDPSRAGLRRELPQGRTRRQVRALERMLVDATERPSTNVRRLKNDLRM